jgi:hypothetical protein
MACRGSVDKSARRIRSTFADQFKVTPKRRAFFFGDVRRPQTQLSGSVRAWSCLLGLSRVGDEDHCGVTRRNFAVSVLRPRVVAIDPAASDTHTPCIPGRASTNRFPGFSREALAHIGQPSCRSNLVVACQSNRHAAVCASVAYDLLVVSLTFLARCAFLIMCRPPKPPSARAHKFFGGTRTLGQIWVSMHSRTLAIACKPCKARQSAGPVS